MVTNAVSTDGKNLIFISNGEAGVYIASAELELKSSDSEKDQGFNLIGKLRFDSLQSVNHVDYKNGLLFVAAGACGLKIVKVDEQIGQSSGVPGKKK